MLGSLLPANSDWTLGGAAGINNSDQIVGTATYQGKQQADLLSLGSGGGSEGSAGGSGGTSGCSGQATPLQVTEIVSFSQNNRGYVRLVHVGPDGIEVESFFKIVLDKLPTGPARGNDMLIN
jgi:hypothetical protein